MRKAIKVTSVVLAVVLALGSVGFNAYVMFVGWRANVQQQAFNAGVQTAAGEIVKQAEAGSAKIGLDEGKRVVELVVKSSQTTTPPAPTPPTP